jgi:pyruvate, water dikinase
MGVASSVASSATAEDTAETSFAGMNESFLNVRGGDAVIDAVRRCWRSLFGTRTIYYRGVNGFGQADMDIAVIVQRQIESTRAEVMFTVNPATGDRNEMVIEGSFGLGEAVVSGSVSPDRYLIEKDPLWLRRRDVHFKELAVEYDPEGGTRTRRLSRDEGLRPVLDESEVLAAAELGLRIEKHYGSPQDTEWAFDPDGKLWAAERLGDGDVLVTHMTAPDWLPLLRRAAGIVTDSGGMTCHAAIVSRELGIPAVVGTGDATSKLHDGEIVTVDATDGVVLEGARGPATAVRTQAKALSAPVPAAARVVTGTQILVNLSESSQVQRAAVLDVDGVGLLRAELMVLEALGGDHPRTLLQEGRGEDLVSSMAEGLSAFAPRPITYRTIDFRTNEFRGLRGGESFEPQESNPMIGYRGALRYTQEPAVFTLELAAVRQVWDRGHRNLHVMLPFVRTTEELRRCRELVGQSGLLARRGFELWVMAEVPSVLFNLADYAALGVAGISIGSNDLTQLVLGADRDNEVLADTFDERDPAVTAYLRELIPRARGLGLRTSICGQAPSVHPEYTELLVRAGIDAISVNVDAVPRTRALVASAERRVLLDFARAHGTPDAPSSV